MSFYTIEDTFGYFPSIPPGCLLEFGVLSGNCMRRIIRGAMDKEYRFNKVFGFDAWDGLPEEENGVWRSQDWPPSAFSTKKDFNLKTNEECIDFVSKRIHEVIPKEECPELKFYSGYFTESLNEEVGNYLQRSISYCHVDVDLYISTKQCLNWLFKYNILKQNAFVRFDDWLYNGQWAGNNRAFAELTQKYNILWGRVADNCYIYLNHDRS